MSVFSRRRETLWPSGNVGQGEMVGRGRSKRPSRTGLARVGGDVWLSVGWLRHRRCRQAVTGIARSRARARLNWVSHGQRLGRCRVNRRAERVSRPAIEKKRRRRVLVVTSCSPRPMRAAQRARLCAITCTASQAALAAKRPEGRWFNPTPYFRSRLNTKLKPRWDLHLWGDEDWLRRHSEALPNVPEGRGPTPPLEPPLYVHFTLVSAYMNPWFTTTDEKGSRLRYAGPGQWCAIGRLNLVLGARVSA